MSISKRRRRRGGHYRPVLSNEHLYTACHARALDMACCFSWSAALTMVRVVSHTMS